MKLRAKLLLPVIIVTAAMSFLTIYLIAEQVEGDALERAQSVTAEYLVAKARQSLAPETFQNPDLQRQKPLFEAFLHQIRTPEILKIKVFNAKFDIIYSTTAEDIGKKTDSANYRKALLENRVTASIKPPFSEQANIDLYGYRQLMEIYVPISYDGRIEGVIEAYFKMDGINQAIRDTSRKVVSLIVALAFVICLLLYVVLSVIVVRPLRILTGVIGKIAAGDAGILLPYLSGRDEIGALGKALQNLMETVANLRKGR